MMSDRNQQTEESAADEFAEESVADSENPSQEKEPSRRSTDHETINNNKENQLKKRDIWPQFRQLLVFQLKLYVDAARDLLMSPLSIVVFIVDAIQGNQGDNSLFESLLKFGRKTETAINLFNQHDIDDENYRGIDSILLQVEDAVRKEYTDGSVSTTARESIEKSLDRLRSRLNKSMEDNE